MSRFFAVIFVAAIGTGSALAQSPPETSGSPIGYPNVATALSALRTRPDIQFSVQGGWIIASEPAHNILWSFAPEGNPAYPSAVKRGLKEVNGAINIETKILCEAPKAACDKLAIDFQKLNDGIKQSVQSPAR